MGSYISRFHSDGFANYEKSMQRLKSEADRLQRQKAVRQKRLDTINGKIMLWATVLFGAALAYAAWVLRRPPGSYTALGHFVRVSPVVFEPILAYFAHDAIKWLASWDAQRDENRLKTLEAKLRSIVSELKDSTRYQRTQRLLAQYDPDYAPTAMAGAARRTVATSPQVPAKTAGGPQGAGVGTPAGPQSQLQRRVTGLSLLPSLDKLANSLIGDNPVLTEGLREARGEAEALRERLAAAERRAAELADENAALRRRLGEDAVSAPATPGAVPDRADNYQIDWPESEEDIEPEAKQPPVPSSARDVAAVPGTQAPTDADLAAAALQPLPDSSQAGTAGAKPHAALDTKKGA